MKEKDFILQVTEPYPSTDLRIPISYFKACVNEEEDFQKPNLNVLLRLAYHPATREFVQNKFKVRGLVLAEDVKIKPHQEKAILWMKKREEQEYRGVRGGILALEKGLGKTLSTIIHILSSPRGPTPTLIVCKKMIIADTWWMEFSRRVLSEVKVLFLHSDFTTKGEILALKPSSFKGVDVVVTTYEFCSRVCSKLEIWKEHATLSADGKVLKLSIPENPSIKESVKSGAGVIYGIKWQRVVCDESQNFTNIHSAAYRSMMCLCSTYRWGLSGNMFKNYSTDIYAQLKFLGYGPSINAREWKRSGREIYNSQKLSELIFQMSYMDAEIEMPKRIEYEILVPLEGKFLTIYNTLKSTLLGILNSRGGSSNSHILALLTRLRQTLVSPYLFTSSFASLDPFEGEEDPLQEEGTNKIVLKELFSPETFKWCLNQKEAGWEAPKIKKAFELIDEILKRDGKVIIFSTQVSALDLIASKLDEEYYPGVDEDWEGYLPTSYQMITGSVTGEARVKALNSFRFDRECHILLATYKVCSEGLNLTEAEYCILLDHWWNNVTRSQSVARLWRMGQKKDVVVFNIFAKNTLDVRIRKICRDKDIEASSYRNGTLKRIKKVSLFDATAEILREE